MQHQHLLQMDITDWIRAMDENPINMLDILEFIFWMICSLVALIVRIAIIISAEAARERHIKRPRVIKRTAQWHCLIPLFLV